MVTAGQLRENSRQGFDVQKQTRIGIESGISRNLRWGCGHVYDETPADIAVYVRNDPVNLVDPDGRFAVGIIDNGDTLYQISLGLLSALSSKSEHKSDIRAKAVQDMLDRWDTLTEQCRNGLTSAMSGAGIGAIKRRLAALDRALADFLRSEACPQSFLLSNQ